MVKQSVPALLIVDVSLPDQDGIALLEAAQIIDTRIIGVVMTGAPTVELAVRAMKAGATKETFDMTVGIHPTTAEDFTTLEVTGWQPQNNPPQKSLRPKNPLPRQPQVNQL